MMKNLCKRFNASKSSPEKNGKQRRGCYFPSRIIFAFRYYYIIEVEGCRSDNDILREPA